MQLSPGHDAFNNCDSHSKLCLRVLVREGRQKVWNVFWRLLHAFHQTYTPRVELCNPPDSPLQAKLDLYSCGMQFICWPEESACAHVCYLFLGRKARRQLGPLLHWKLSDLMCKRNVILQHRTSH